MRSTLADIGGVAAAFGPHSLVRHSASASTQLDGWSAIRTDCHKHLTSRVLQRPGL